MAMLLFNLIISPIEYFLESVFSFFLLYNGLDILKSIFFMSFVFVLLCLPLYYRADLIHKEEERKLSEIQPYIKKIKGNFTGDEQYFMLKTLYRQHNYNPVMGLRKFGYLLLQIPFFIAAYHFFTNLDLFNGFSYSILKDLSKPDLLFCIFGKKINVLPIIMTIINIVSCEAYLRTKSWKDRIQPYSLAIVFFVILYDSPSALVLYWIFNNFFYLMKIIFMDDNKPQKFVFYLLSFGLLFLGFINVYNGETLSSVILKFLYFLLPYVISLLILKYFSNNSEKGYNKDFNRLLVFNFVLCCIGFILLQGFIIPVGLLASDLQPFALEYTTLDIINAIQDNFICLIGLYLFWGSIVFCFIKKEYKKVAIICFISIFLFSFFNYLNFGSKLGILSVSLRFEDKNVVSLICGDTKTKLINTSLFLLILLFVVFSINNSYKRFVSYVLSVIILAEIFISGMYLFNFRKQIELVDDWNKVIKDNSNAVNCIELSKTNKNVIIIFLDRFLGCFLPIILHEKPELKKDYSGFIFYPNTASFHGCTVLGYPPCIGGYEYTPWKLDKDKRSFKEKWQEASLMLLTLFEKNKYTSTVVDPVGDSDINVRFTNDGKNLSDYYIKKNIKYISLLRKYNYYYHKIMPFDELEIKQLQKRLFFYSFFNIGAKVYKEFLYAYGLDYLYKGSIEFNYGFGSSEKYLLSSYSSLANLKNITTTTNSSRNTFTLIHNDLSHCLRFFQYPTYKYSKNITDKGPIKFIDEKTTRCYHTAMASFLLVRDYLKYLKQLGVYDNSRIIIVSDHGNRYVRFPNYDYNQNQAIVSFNPLLMVKDFNQNFELLKDKSFMTNADVPFIATKGIISKPINPFSGKPISIDDKKNGIDIYMDMNYFNASQFTGSKVILDDKPTIRHVKDDYYCLFD